MIPVMLLLYTDREREELSVHLEVRDLVEAREMRDHGESQV